MYSLPKDQRFEREVLSRYNVYNSVFLTLPFENIGNTGALLPLFAEACEKGFADGHSPKDIVTAFLSKYLEDADEKSVIALMFRFVQYIERQVVLFDAVEDAAFAKVNDMEGQGSLREVKDDVESEHRRAAIQEFLAHFNVRTVLTAHPTQFYPGAVLGIITDLTDAIRSDDLPAIKQLLSQLGKTPFIQEEKPTPYDEAVSLVWFLENVFYQTAGEIVSYIRNNKLQAVNSHNEVLSFGFWPGGDRDGNPFVKADTTLKVAGRLKSVLLRLYYGDMRALRRHLTFRHVDAMVSELELRLYSAAYGSGSDLTARQLLDALGSIRKKVRDEHQGLYLEDIDAFIDKVRLFGMHFATLDIRQNSHIHNQVMALLMQNRCGGKSYEDMDDLAKMDCLTHLQDFGGPFREDEMLQDTLASIRAMREIQQHNGEKGCNRYIISNNESAVNVLETLALFKFAGWENPSADIVPLFEIIDDLKHSGQVMETLYTHPVYAAHLRSRGNTQTVMLGFSDGTKDGGYLMANWGIYRAKEAITEVSRRHGIKVIFFDGRGGPPARGGGKTNKFYASLGPEIENREIQLTIQGQTISSNFGTPDSCRFNLENLLSAGISNRLFTRESNRLSTEEKQVLDELAQTGLDKYLELRNRPEFVPYLEKRSTLPYYAKTNIGSRPAKRNVSSKLNLADLRAIPFVGSWSQLKQNVPGFFGVGTALAKYDEPGMWEAVENLYHKSLFFRTLLENSMMSIAKSFMPLTAYMKDDPEFGAFWQIIKDEFDLTRKLLLKIARHEEIMENYPEGKASIAVRERIVQPLLAIQQYALIRISEMEDAPEFPLKPVYEKLVTRSLFGNINASRNSA